MLHRLLLSFAFVGLAGAAIADPLPNDGNTVPGQGSTQSPPQSGGQDGGGYATGDGSTLPSDGNVIPGQGGGSSTGGSPSSSSGTSSGGSQLPSDGNTVPHGNNSSSSQDQQNNPFQDHSI